MATQIKAMALDGNDLFHMTPTDLLNYITAALSSRIKKHDVS